jgi:hypothetical protein
MIGQSELQRLSPSLSRLVKTAAIALATAGTLLVAVVLPAEYAIDPLGTGRRLGLTAIASPPLTPIDTIANADSALLTPVQRGPIGDYPRPYKVDAFEVVLAPYEYVEYKYHLEKGATMVYAWSASAPVVHDFHGERSDPASDGGPAEQSFDKQDRRQASGSFTAPFTGIHGWYWENPGAEPITVRVTSSGFYSGAVEIRSDRTRRPHDLRSPDSASSLGAATTPAARQPQ